MLFVFLLFAIIAFNEAWVRNVWRKIGGVGIGIPSSLDTLMIGRLMRRTDLSFVWNKKDCVELDDKPMWEETRNDDFSIKAMYKMLEAEPSFSFLMTNIWNVCV